MPRLELQSFALLVGSRESGPLGGTEGPDLTRYLLICSLLLVGIVGLAWGFRRLVGRNLAARAARRSLQVMDLLPMGKQKLAVVRCYDRTFLLGIGEREVSLVAELDPAIAPEREEEPTRADRAAFAELFDRLRQGPAEKPAPAPRPGLGAQGVLG